MLQGGHFKRMRNEINGNKCIERRILDLVDREGYTVDGDGAFVGDSGRKHARHTPHQTPGLRHRLH